MLVNGPAFASSTPKTFLANLKLLAATTDRAEGFKKAFSVTMQTLDSVLETVGIAESLRFRRSAARPTRTHWARPITARSRSVTATLLRKVCVGAGFTESD